MNKSNFENLHLNDCFLIKDSTFKKKLYIGKIILISNTVINVSAYVFPEDTRLGLQSHHSKKEVFETNEFKVINDVSALSEKVVLLDFNSYISDIDNVKDNAYFFRQKYSNEKEANQQYTPSLNKICYCNEYFNPDINFVKCSKCGYFYHLKCILDNINKKCINEKCKNKISNQFDQKELIKFKQSNNIKIENSKNHSQSSNTVLLNSKRERYIDDYKEDIKEENTKNKKPKLSSKIYKEEEIIPNPYTLNDFIEDKKQFYKIASDYIYKKINNNNELTKEDKIRISTKIFLLQLHLISSKELLMKPDIYIYEKSKKVPNVYKLIDILSKEEDEKLSLLYNQSLEIELIIFNYSKCKVDSTYIRKLKEIKSYLLEKNRTEQRIQILIRETAFEKLIYTKIIDLFEEAKNTQESYFKSQVLLPEDSNKLVLKTHKEERLIEFDESMKIKNENNKINLIEMRFSDDENIFSDMSDYERDKTQENVIAMNIKTVNEINQKYHTNFTINDTFEIKLYQGFKRYTYDYQLDKINRLINKLNIEDRKAIEELESNDKENFNINF